MCKTAFKKFHLVHSWILCPIYRNGRISRFEKISFILCITKVVCCSNDAHYCLQILEKSTLLNFFSQCEVQPFCTFDKRSLQNVLRNEKRIIAQTYVQVFWMFYSFTLNLQNGLKLTSETSDVFIVYFEKVSVLFFRVFFVTFEQVFWRLGFHFVLYCCSLIYSEAKIWT